MSLGGGGGGEGRQQLQQLQQAIEAVEEEVVEAQAEIDALRQEQRDIDEAADALGDLDTGSTVQVPLGGGTYVSAEIVDIDEVIVTLGGGYAAEQDQDDATEALERKKAQIDDQIDDLQEEVTDLEAEREELEGQAQQLQQQLQQQQMQQLQQQQGDE